MISWIDAADFSGAEGTAEKTELTKLMEMRNYGNTELQKYRVKGNSLKKQMR